jgi:glycerophosphoryl diester phosphodiesterase
VRAARTSMEEILAHALASAGYSASYPPGSPGWRAKPVYVQSFEETSLQRFASLMPLPLVLLLDASPDYVAPDTGLSWRQQVSPQHLAELATYVAGIGPWKGSLFADNNTTTTSSSSPAQIAASGRAALQSASSTTYTCTQAVKSSGLTAQLHAHAFSVHPYTLRDEAQFVLPGCGGNITCEIAAMFDGEQVDGAFTDWPATLRNALSSRTGGPSVPLTARVLSANSAVLWRQLVSRSPFSWLSLYK